MFAAFSIYKIDVGFVAEIKDPNARFSLLLKLMEPNMASNFIQINTVNMEIIVPKVE